MLEFLQEKLTSQYGETVKEEIWEAFANKRITTLRINTIKSDKDEVKKVLEENGIKFEEVSWFDNALVVDCNEEKIMSLELFESGKIYLQSLSSMIPPIVLKPCENEDILDMAAAPGGKTTELAALSNNKAHITACEMNKVRFERLKYNVEKQGAKSVYLMQKDSRNLDDFFKFDKILLDSPCTGSGTIYLNDKNRLEPEYLLKIASTQEKLLAKACKMLKNNGEIVYSTCSILKEENEEIINKIKDKFNMEIVPIEIEGLPELKCEIAGAKVIKPNKYFEGFFVCKLKRK